MSPAVSLAPACCSESGGDSEIGDYSLQQGSGEASPSGAGARVVQEWVDSIEDAEDPEEDYDDDDLRAYWQPPGEEDRFRRESAPSPEPSPLPLSPPPSPPTGHNNNN